MILTLYATIHSGLILEEGRVISKNVLRIIPLGGLGEFGMNMMALEVGDDLLVIDAGVMFPGIGHLGVDIVIPDISYLKENQSRIQAIILTHGHEDHIGALPYVLEEINIPVYGSAFTLALARSKLAEHALLDGSDLREMRPREPFTVGPFKIDFLPMTHSIIDAGALAIQTPIGTVLHTGDFKLDSTPPDGKMSDLHGLAEYGKRGVLAMFSDSTNVERPGISPSERAVRDRFLDIFTQATGRILVSSFSTSVHRMQLVVDLADQFGRQLAVTGRSMMKVAEISQKMGPLKIPPGLLIPPHEVRKVPRDKVVVLMTGTQGEPMAALSRAAVQKHRHVEITPGDNVVISARVIPGNEVSIFRMIDHLYRRGARIQYDDGSQPPIHVSGHASREELALMLNLVRPRYFIPIHGEYRQLYRHTQLAHEMGIPKENIFLLESGEVLELNEEIAQRVNPVTVGRVCIDVGTLDEVEEVILKERRHISEDGIVIPVLVINRHTGKLESQPDIISRGFISMDETQDLVFSARRVIEKTLSKSSLEELTDWGVVKEKIRVSLRRHMDKETGKRPMILPIILEV